jgi:hypothetical protein
MALMNKTEPTFTSEQNLQIGTSTDGMHQQWEPPLPRSRRGTSTGHTRNYCKEEIHQCPIMYEQLYKKREEVAISKSGLPGAGRGLFGIRLSKSNPLLFKQANEFVCVYATMQNAISVMEAQVTESAYVWTNSKNVHIEWDPAADKGNNCMIKWNARRRRAEVWTVVNVPLYKKLGAAYNDPYWYRTNNGIQTRAQAVQIRDYNNRSKLPPYETNEMEANIPASSPEPMSAHVVGQHAPNLSIISIDEGMVNVPAPQETAANVTIEEKK